MPEPVAVIGGVLMLIMGGEPELLDYKIEIQNMDVNPGSKVYFTNNLINMGSKRRYDIILEYRLTEMKTDTVVDTRGETIGVSTTISRTADMLVPQLAEPGRYRLEGKVTYGDQEASSFATFNVVVQPIEESCYDSIKNQDETGIDCGGVCAECSIEPEESCSDGIRNQDEKAIDCGGVCVPCPDEESCSDGLQKQDEIGVDCGGSCDPCSDTVKPDNEEILAKVNSLGTTNEKESVRLCNLIDNARLKDDCFLEISGFFDKPSYCERINSNSVTNICYMYFVQKGDYSVCEKIEDVYIKRSCESLQQINSIMEQQPS